MAHNRKSTRPTFLAPGVLNKRKLQPNLLSGFFSRGGIGEASSRKGGSSPSVVAAPAQHNQDGVGGVASHKEMDTNLISSNTEHVSTNMSRVTRDLVLPGTEEEANENVNDGTLMQIDDSGTHTTTKRKKRDLNAKTRGANKCKKVANLGEGVKLQVDFYNNGPVGDNQGGMVRHMGKLVRDRTIVLIRVHSWDEVDENVKEHLWLSSKFGGHGMDLRRSTILNHMKRLWQTWRALMKQDDINKKETLEDSLKEVPNNLTKEDWHWLVKEHYTIDKFKKVSVRNSENRGNVTMPHRVGSMPFRQVVWDEMGGKDGKQTSISEIFKKTRSRTRKCGTLDEASSKKCDEIVDVERENPSMSLFEVVATCFGEQDRDHVVCFGFGVKPKHVRGPISSCEELTIKLREKEKENDDLKKRIDEMVETTKKCWKTTKRRVKKMRKRKMTWKEKLTCS